MLDKMIVSDGVLVSTDDDSSAVSLPRVVSEAIEGVADVDSFYSDDIRNGNRLAIRDGDEFSRITVSLEPGPVSSGAIVSDGVIVAQENDAVTTSKVFYAEEEIVALKNIQAKYIFENISTATENDMLETFAPIIDGDNLTVVLDDDSTVDIVASEVSTVSTHYAWDVVGSTVAKTNSNYTVKSSFNGHANSQCYTELISEDFTASFSFLGTSNLIGISTINTKQDDYFASVSTGYGLVLNNGLKYNSGTNTSTGLTFATSDIVRVTYEYTTGKFSMSKNDEPLVLLFTLSANTPVYLATSLYESSFIVTSELCYVCTMSTISSTSGEVPSRVYATDVGLSFGYSDSYDTANKASDNKDLFIITRDTVDIFYDGSGVALWRLDGDYDDSGLAYNGTPRASITFSGGSVLGNSTSMYSGRNGCATFPMPILNDEISLSFWVYPVNPSSDSGALWLFHFSLNDGNSFAVLNHQTVVSNTDVWYTYSEGYNGRLDSYIGVAYNTWRHYIFTTRGTIYENGIMKTSTGGPKKTNMSNINRDLVLFGDRDGGETFNEYFNGHIAQARLINRHVEEHEALLLYKEVEKDILKTTIAYNDLELSRKKIRTKVELGHTSDKCIEVSADAWTED